MGAKLSAVEMTAVEREIVERIAAVKLRLRFDKVVLRLVSRLKAALAEVVQEDQTVIFTVAAPIRLPAKTSAALESVVRSGLSGGELDGVIQGNPVQIRLVRGVQSSMPRVVGFVHDPESSASLILVLAESCLLERR